MNILYGMSVFALCANFYYGANGQATCSLSYDDETELQSSYWEFGLVLPDISDVTEPGTILLNMTATSITRISSIQITSASKSTFMQPTLVDNRFVLTLTDSFTNYEQLEIAPSIRITVTFVCTTDNRLLEINQPITDTNNHYPEFQGTPYIYELPMPFPANFPIELFGDISARDIDLTNGNISFTLNSSDPVADGFSAYWLSQDASDTKLHFAELLTTTLLRLTGKITFDIFATDIGTPPLTSKTSITIGVDEANSTPNSPIFAHPVYITDQSNLTIEEAKGIVLSFDQGDISLSQGAASTVIFDITDNIGSNENNFLLTMSEDYESVTVTLQNVSEEFLAQKFSILTLTATRSGASDPGVTILHVTLPGILSDIPCPEECSTPADCPEVATEVTPSLPECVCNETTPAPLPTTATLLFPSNIYRFDKESTYTGILMKQTAVATNAEGTILYDVVIDDAGLASKITIDTITAEVQVTAAISPATYTFQITAKIEELELSTATTVVLVISTLTDCNGESVFDYALRIIELDEESPHENIIPIDDNGCEYTIYSQTPNEDLFSISGNHLNAVAIDREASYFSETSIAQVRVVIDASCLNENTTDFKTTIPNRSTKNAILTENIQYIRTRTTLIVIINDINDNAPVWSSETPSCIAFPGHALAQIINVPYVYEFSATDADIGDNGIVTYTLRMANDPADIFYIQSESGTLYIQKGVYVRNDLTFTVIATDGKHETPKDITMRMLEATNVVVLFVDGGVLEDTNAIVNEIGTNTGLEVRSIGSAVVSASDAPNATVGDPPHLHSIFITREAKRDVRPNTLLRLVLYGLEDNILLDSKTLLSSLEHASLNWTVADAATFEAIVNSKIEDYPMEVNTRGYWAAIIVLSVVLILFIIVSIVVYVLFCRPPKATSVESDVTYEYFENRNSNGSNENNPPKTITLADAHERSESTDSANAAWIDKQKIPSSVENLDSNYGRKSFSVLKDSNDDDFFNISRTQSMSDLGASENSKRKSVAFKNTVEEIEVDRL
ncbi:uncharacterized protein LOC105684240 isoform X1 [Athalia rosae]|uniref:uncharacterized protein LOC105684240 isoform X1 n=1 Tax=Athalia rosae TaxID=37344 RepID=UPI002033DAF9|nr:uncharacterized protein LOC105684240 isoform X1 [Athalia rosae]